MNPFLKLDELRESRYADQRKREDERMKQWADAPLTASALLTEYQDRKAAADERARKAALEARQMDVTESNASRMQDWTKAQTRNLDADNTRQQAIFDQQQAERELQNRLKGERTAAESAAMPYVTGTVAKKEITPEEFDAAALAKDFQQEAFLKNAREANTFPHLSDDEVRGIYQEQKLKRGDVDWKQGLEEQKLKDRKEMWSESISARLEMQRRKASAGGQAAGHKMLAKFQQDINSASIGLNKIESLKKNVQAGKGLTGAGPLSEMYDNINQWLGRPDVDQTAFAVDMADIVNQQISDFGGKAVTPQEMQRVMRQMPSVRDSKEALVYILDHLSDRSKYAIDQTFSTASMMQGGEGFAGKTWQDVVIPSSGVSGAQGGQPKVQPASPKEVADFNKEAQAFQLELKAALGMK